MKKITKVLSVLMAVVMLMTALCVPATAASIESTAVKISSGKSYSKKMTDGYNNGHYGTYADYKIVCSKSGTVSIKLTATTKYVDLQLFDSDFDEVEVSGFSVTTGETCNSVGIARKMDFEGEDYAAYYWNRTAEKSVSTTKWSVKKGTYYLRICNDSDPSYGHNGTDGKITFTATFPSSSSSSSSAKISYLSIEVPKGSKMQLAAVVSAKTSKSVSWSSSNSSVVSVTSKGKITAKKKGVAVITAKLGSSTMKIRIKVV